MKRANGTGSIIKLKGNRRRPYAVRITTGFNDKGYPIYKYVSYHKTQKEAQRAIAMYTDDPYTVSQKTFADIYAEWLPLQNKKAEGTLRAYKSAYNSSKSLHKVKMASIDRITLQHFYDNIDGTRSTVRSVKKLLNQLIKYSVKCGIMPLTALSLHKAIDFGDRTENYKTERRIIPKDIIDKLWDLTDQETVKQILLYIYTGCRFAELYELQPENCYPDHIDIIASKTEAGIRTVPLCDKVLNLLPIEPIPSYVVFNKQFKEVLPGYHIHDTRHTFITMMTEAGIDSRIIKAIVGHKTNDITDHYTHITLDKMLEAVNKI